MVILPQVKVDAFYAVPRVARIGATAEDIGCLFVRVFQLKTNEMGCGDFRIALEKAIITNGTCFSKLVTYALHFLR